MIWNLTVFLSIIWALNLLYGEWFAYLVPSLWTCSWPHLQRPSSSLPNGVDYSSNYVKIAVITDPQLMDRTSLPLAPKSLALEIAQFYTDLYMRRAFLSSVLPFDPDVILFLGDYFDGGDKLSDDEWSESLGRFKHIFNLNMIQKSSKLRVYYLSGNHDIGYSAFNSRNPKIVNRYKRMFGASNFKVKLGKVDFVAVDAQTLDGHSRGNLTTDTWEFIKSVSEANEVLIFKKLGNLMASVRSLYNSFRNRVKEKNEDENCEYEEIWDAEGSMHLIKKTKKISPTSLNETSSVDRGNAVMRSKLRKQTALEQDASTADVSIHIGTTRTNRSKAKMIIWRLLRALRALITIAALNFPIYVLLVFKDWIDK
ncbi:cell division control protein 1 [Phtheirospermum japonicum]|uniref:Cell division control protein 1 n=1 Tax=Phtheirospermum japonicum TaxID=374723 RepID=A0A830D7S4_9LAMI|nr:cell division control protein 1 [Phtheirospermum japonicum]